MGVAFFLLCDYVRLFFYRFMEEPEAIDFLSALVPFTIIVFIIAVGVILLTQQFRKNLFKQQLAKEGLKNQHQQALLQTSIEVQEQERKRIAQDLHDELGATLSISRMQLLQLERQLTNGNDEQTEQLKQVRENVEGALSSTRRISHELMPVQLVNGGLVSMLQTQAKQVNDAGNLEVMVEVNEDFIDLPWTTQVGLYRVFAELLNNTLKHANASLVKINLEQVEQKLSFHYKDNGNGLPEDLSHAGLGLKGLEGRVKALNGELQYGNEPQGGFFAQIVVELGK